MTTQQIREALPRSRYLNQVGQEEGGNQATIEGHKVFGLVYDITAEARRDGELLCIVYKTVYEDYKIVLTRQLFLPGEQDRMQEVSSHINSEIAKVLKSGFLCCVFTHWLKEGKDNYYFLPLARDREGLFSYMSEALKTLPINTLVLPEEHRDSLKRLLKTGSDYMLTGGYSSISVIDPTVYAKSKGIKD